MCFDCPLPAIEDTRQSEIFLPSPADHFSRVKIEPETSRHCPLGSSKGYAQKKLMSSRVGNTTKTANSYIFRKR